MTLEVRVDASGQRNVVLTECPVCGEPLGRDKPGMRRTHFLVEHGPEDFGLSPMETTVAERRRA